MKILKIDGLYLPGGVACCSLVVMAAPVNKVKKVNITN